MLWCSVQDIRRRKSSMVMEALAKGWPGAKLCDGDPPDDGNPFAIYGQTWGAERLIPPALKSGRPFWQIDNGFWRPGRGSPDGYYRFCYRSLTPVYLAWATRKRAAMTGIGMTPWRKNGEHIMFAAPGGDFGTALGLDMEFFSLCMPTLIRNHTDRPIIIRDRKSQIPLSVQLQNCWALVTHSSNVAVEAICSGVPVFVAATSAAAPVGNRTLKLLENPAMPDNRRQWWRSLMCQQFTPAEMASGVAYECLAAVRAQVDGKAVAA